MCNVSLLGVILPALITSQIKQQDIDPVVITLIPPLSHLVCFLQNSNVTIGDRRKTNEETEKRSEMPERQRNE